MFDRFFEWMASRRDPRFAAYREARLLYEAHVAEVGTPFHALTDEQRERAAGDPALGRVEALYRKALEQSRQEGAEGDVAIACFQLGLLYHLQGRRADAGDSFRRALAVFEASPFPPQSIQEAAGDCHYHLAIIARHEGRLADAGRHLRRARSFATAAGDFRGMSLFPELMAQWELPADDGPSLAPRATAPSLPRAAPAPPPKATPPPIDRGEPSLARYELTVEVLWLVSHTQGRNDAYFAPLGGVAASLPRELRVCRLATAGSGGRPVEPPARAANERLCGAVVIVERAGLDDPSFRGIVEACVERVARFDDFRLFACLEDGLVLADVHARGEAGDRLCQRLFEAVQVADAASPAKLRDAVADYLGRLDGIRRGAAWRRLDGGLRIAAAWSATAVQVLALVAVAAGVFAFASLGKDSALARLIAEHAAATGLVASLLIWPAQTPAVYYILRGLGAANQPAARHPNVVRSFAAGMGVAYAAGWLNTQAAAPWPWVVLGFVGGVLVDSARRGGAAAARRAYGLASALRAGTAVELPAEAVAGAAGAPPDPVRCAALPPAAPKVFISYGRSLAWSHEIAYGLRDRLVARRVECFLDAFGLPEGGNWPRELHRRLAEATVIVAVVEPETLGRQWVAAELVTALRGRHLTGLPEIVVLAHPDLAAGLPEEVLPVFRALLAAAGDGEPGTHRPRIVTVCDPALTEQVVTDGLARQPGPAGAGAATMGGAGAGGFDGAGGARVGVRASRPSRPAVRPSRSGGALPPERNPFRLGGSQRRVPLSRVLVRVLRAACCGDVLRVAPADRRWASRAWHGGVRTASRLVGGPSRTARARVGGRPHGLRVGLQ